MKKILITVLILLFSTTIVNATSLEKRHQLGLKIGMWSQTADTLVEIGIGGVETSVDNNGMLISINYGHWFQENLAMTFNLKIMALDISNSVDYASVTSETSAVTSMLLGVKYYFVSSSLDGSARPFLTASVGPFIGEQSSSNISSSVVVESRSEFAVGGYLGGGVDIITGRHFMLGVGAGYNLMTDFSNPIGGSKNYSGPEFGFSFNWLFGKGVQ